MNGDAECTVAARFQTVRKHLDSLGYRQALSLDALPLIEALLTDLIQTTDSLKHFKAVAQENVEVRRSFDRGNVPSGPSDFVETFECSPVCPTSSES